VAFRSLSAWFFFFFFFTFARHLLCSLSREFTNVPIPIFSPSRSDFNVST